MDNVGYKGRRSPGTLVKGASPAHVYVHAPRHKTVDRARDGVEKWGAIFQRMMEWVLKDLDCAGAYIDDVIIGSRGESDEYAIENLIVDSGQCWTA